MSLIPSLRRHGNKVERSETLLTASTYYTPEGRFYDSPVILKRKKHRLHVLPMVLGVGLTA
ncbi:MAG: cell wall hydrolase, partial [Bartonella sp.]|nr:cell wall hydrolase [Bartonella sp.]